MKKILLKIVKIILLVLCGLIVMFFIVMGIGRLINAHKYKIRSENGVQKSYYVTLGGIDQYIQIRGQDVSNPVMIVLHGGPGGNMAYWSYHWQSYLEKEYTIVHWDQRGCGNTYYRSKETERPTLDLLLSDLDELVDYLRKEYGKDKVIITAHSWGTNIGAIYSGTHPEKVSAYVGIGQFVNFWSGEQLAANEAARLATKAGKTDDALKIENQFKVVKSNRDFDIKELIKLRQLTSKYLPSGGGMDILLGLFSPYMTFSDLKWFMLQIVDIDKIAEIQSDLYKASFSENGASLYDYTLTYKIPITIIAGDADWITPYSIAEEYCNAVSSPKKEFILIEGAGHTPFLDKPEMFAKVLSENLNK